MPKPTRSNRRASKLGVLAAALLIHASIDGAAAQSLDRGYNLVGWTGSTTDILAASASIADGFSDLRVYGAETGEFSRFRDGASAELNTLEEIPYGAGVWVLADGPLDWAEPPVAPSTTVGLEEGQNLVAWLGADGTAIEDAVSTLGDSLVSVHAWNPATERFAVYAPDAPPEVQEAISVDHGDAIWINVSRAVDWAQTIPGIDAAGAVVDAAGAVVAHASGATVEVPPGALPEGAGISLYEASSPANLPDTVQTFGNAYGIAAAGRLQGLATVRLPLPSLPGGVTIDDVVLFRIGRDGTAQDIGGTIDGNTIVATTSSFSTIVTGQRNASVKIFGPTVVSGGSEFGEQGRYIAADFLDGRSDTGIPFSRFVWTLQSSDDIFDDHQPGTQRHSTVVNYAARTTPGSGTIKVEAIRGSVSASDTLTVMINPDAFWIDARVRSAVIQNDLHIFPDEPALFTVTVRNGAPPFIYRFEFADDDVLQEFAPSPVTTLTRSFDSPGSKTVRITAIDANEQFAETTAAVNIQGTLEVALDGPQRASVDATHRYDVSVTGISPPVSLSAESVGVVLGDPGVAPVIGAVSASGSNAFAPLDWTPTEPGTFALRVEAEDQLFREAQDIAIVRVSGLEANFTSAPSLLEVGEDGMVTVSIEGGEPPFDVTLASNREEVTESFVFDTPTAAPGGFITEERTVAIPFTLEEAGEHELTVSVSADGQSSSATILVDAVVITPLTQRTWVKIHTQFNPDGLPLVLETVSPFSRQVVECVPPRIDDDLMIFEKRVQLEFTPVVTRNVRFEGVFEIPPDSVPAADDLTLDFSVASEGFDSGSVGSTSVTSGYRRNDSFRGDIIALHTCAHRNVSPPCQFGGEDRPKTDMGSADGFLDELDEPIGTIRRITAAFDHSSNFECRVEWTYELMGPEE